MKIVHRYYQIYYLQLFQSDTDQKVLCRSSSGRAILRSYLMKYSIILSESSLPLLVSSALSFWLFFVRRSCLPFKPAALPMKYRLRQLVSCLT
jgi:hypothetical protein